jgi:hypothetical protein
LVDLPHRLHWSLAGPVSVVVVIFSVEVMNHRVLSVY